MKITLRLLSVASALVVASACTLQSQDAPSPTGPSEFALSLQVGASPDVIFQDGGSQSLITIVARDHNAQPISGLGLLVQTAVNGSLVDFGRLSAKSLVTDAQGKATVVYTAPAAPPPTATSDSVVRIVVTPVGSNYDNSMSRDVSIRLSRPGVILPPNGTPTASFSFSPGSPLVGQEVNFDASDSTDDGSIVTYHWNWGDGDAESTSQATIQKDYEAPGTFTVRLTVTDDNGLSASTDSSITIGGSQDPTAEFTFSPTDPNPGTIVTFDATETVAPEGRTIVSYRWNFGDTPEQDETQATGRIVPHAYDESFTYTVTLTVFDSAGRQDSISKTVTVGEDIGAAFTFTPENPTTADVIRFDASGTTPPEDETVAQYIWTYGDGSSFTTTSAAHDKDSNGGRYTSAGSYTVGLTVVFSNGATSSTSRTITIASP